MTFPSRMSFVFPRLISVFFSPSLGKTSRLSRKQYYFPLEQTSGVYQSILLILVRIYEVPTVINMKKYSRSQGYVGRNTIYTSKRGLELLMNA